jgi:aldehyde dehydrogenase (NAD+)
MTTDLRPGTGASASSARDEQDGRVYQLYIDGQWRDGSAMFGSVDPYTGKVWAQIPSGAPADVDDAVTAARRAFDNGPWRRMRARERAGMLNELADLIEAAGDRLAIIESIDNGKAAREIRGQIRSLPNWYRYFAEWADKIHGETIPEVAPGIVNITVREPLGVIAAITAFNSPLLLCAWKVAPALAAGNTVVVKPSEVSSASTLELAKLVEQAGFPRGVFNVVTGFGAEVGAPLAAHAGVDKLSFTGSTATGRAVMRGAAEHNAGVTLELGGKSANIVFADADIGAAANGAIAGAFSAGGQTCMAGSRLLVQEPVVDEISDRLSARARTIVLGDPLDPATEVGPIAFQQHRDRVLGFINSAVREGATPVAGGGRPSDPALADGFFVEPTVLRGVDNKMRVAREEIFGPVVSVIPFSEADEAVAIANDSDFGLAAGVWTRDLATAHTTAARLNTGSVWVNTYRRVSPASPTGGRRGSGVGRENGHDGLMEFTQVKSIWLNVAGEERDPFQLL